MRNNTWALGIMILAAASLWACGDGSDPDEVRMFMLTRSGIGPSIGTVRTTETPHGVVFTPDLEGLPPGLHGFHLHEEGNCAPAEKDGEMLPGLAAGGHYDPAGTKAHEGPLGNGHLGDLPALYVDPDGRATWPILAPRLSASDLKGRALLIHAGGDNYADIPEKDGGGGIRIACGVIPE